jgi:[protein-PII] uridylyltransferase
MLLFLVHRHLLMADTAFQRDPYDEKVLLPFARAVATPEVLRMLLILTVADIAAVGPGVLTKWKESLLVQLYLRTLPEVSREWDETAGPDRLKQLASEVALECTDVAAGGLDWIESQLDQFPLRYLHGTPPKRIAAHLQAVGRLQAREVLVEESFNEELATCEYTVITHNNLTPGIFYKIAGVMAAQGVQILDALIITRHDGIVVDTFQVSDPDYVGVIPVERRASIAETIVRVLKGEEEEVDRLMSQNTRLFAVRRLPTVRQATEVQVLNELSDRFTIIDVYAEDTQGLLYAISRSIFQLGLSVHAARISLRQELDQVADVFYVTDQHGAKINDHARLEAIRTTIKKDIDLFRDQQMAGSEGVSTGSAA